MSPNTRIAAIAPTPKLSQKAGAAKKVMSLYDVGELSDVATETATPLTASPTPAMATVLFKARSLLAFSRSIIPPIVLVRFYKIDKPGDRKW